MKVNGYKLHLLLLRKYFRNTLVSLVFEADHSGRAVQGLKSLHSLEHWDRGFESYSSHGCLSVFIHLTEWDIGTMSRNLEN
jgi:hypothetical protein